MKNHQKLHISSSLEFPEKLKPVFAKAIRYEWLTFFYMISAVIFSFLVMSNSQTMKTIFLEDLLGIIPPLSFLISSKIVKWRANKNFPYGFHKVTSLAFFTSALSLFCLGLFLLVDGIMVLVDQQIPDLPMIQLGGYTFWLGYLMIVALLWSGIPTTFLGHIKIPLANELYDKILYSDSKMNKASWMSAFASIIGIIGIGMGYWWADAGMGILISLSIINDGYHNLKDAILDLLDEVPKSVQHSKTDPLIPAVEKLIAEEDWIENFASRFRDDGHVFFGEVFIVPKQQTRDILEKITQLQKKIKTFHWRMHDIVIMPVLNKEKNEKQNH